MCYKTGYVKSIVIFLFFIFLFFFWLLHNNKWMGMLNRSNFFEVIIVCIVESILPIGATSIK